MRDHRWMTADAQAKRLEGCRAILSLGGGRRLKEVTRAELAPLVRPGTMVLMVYPFLLAEPNARHKRGGLHADFDAALAQLVDKRGGHVRDVLTGASTETTEGRRAMTLLAYDQIARHNQGRRSADNGARSRGRPKLWEDPGVQKIIWEEWHSSENPTNTAASKAAGVRIGQYVSINTMWRIVKQMRAAKGLKGKGASGRRPNSTAAKVAAEIGSIDTAGPKPPPPRRGVVYFIQNGDQGRVKIGFSERHAFRLSTLQGATPDALTLIGTIPGNAKLEKKMHERFKEQRIHPRREWFRVEGKLAAFLKTLSKTTN